MGKPKDPDYWRKWRAAHPDYRKREGERRRRRRACMTPEERRKERGRSVRRAREPVEIPPLHQGHDLFDQAKRIAGMTSGFKYLTHPFYDDLISELGVGLLEGADPTEVRRSFLRRERDWLFKTISLTGVVKEAPLEDPLAL